MDFNKRIAELEVLLAETKVLSFTKHGLAKLTDLKNGIHQSIQLLKQMRGYNVFPSFGSDGQQTYILCSWTGTDWELVKIFAEEPAGLEIELSLDRHKQGC